MGTEVFAIAGHRIRNGSTIAGCAGIATFRRSFIGALGNSTTAMVERRQRINGETGAAYSFQPFLLYPQSLPHFPDGHFANSTVR